ncbi:MAG: Ldh family oxidoreductase [Halanaeroarchaeum sp.]
MARISPADLHEGVVVLLESFGTPADIADRVAESLVDADLKGHHSHGVLRVPLYGERAETSRLDPDARPEVVRANGPVVRMDGRYAFGQYNGREMIDLITDATAEYGVGVVSIRNATHLGRMGEWAERAADADAMFVGLARASTLTVGMAGSAERRIATNPMTFGVPTFDALQFPIVLDIATSQVAHGKIRERDHTDERVPEAWTTTDAGEPVTDPRAFEEGEGALLPLGGRESGYKGFGLAVMAELFSGILGAGHVAGQSTDRTGGNDAVFVAVDPRQFTSRADVEDQVTAFDDHVRGTEFSEHVSAGVAAHGENAMLPGEPEYVTAREQRERGIDLADRIVESLAEFGTEQGVRTDLPAAFDL